MTSTSSVELDPWSPPAFDGRVGHPTTATDGRAALEVLTFAGEHSEHVLVLARCALSDLEIRSLLNDIGTRGDAGPATFVLQGTGTTSRDDAVQACSPFGSSPSIAGRGSGASNDLADRIIAAAARARSMMPRACVEWAPVQLPWDGQADPAQVGRVTPVEGSSWLIVMAPSANGPEAEQMRSAAIDTIRHWADMDAVLLDGPQPMIMTRDPRSHGRSLGHAVLSTVAALPPPRMALRLTSIVESGAPLAPWLAEPREPRTSAGPCGGEQGFDQPAFRLGDSRIVIRCAAGRHPHPDEAYIPVKGSAVQVFDAGH